MADVKSKTKEYFMMQAIRQAKKAEIEDEVPIGAVIVRNGEIIARAFNKRESSQMATFHAEVLAINKACKKLHSWRLDDCELFVTLEPCVMCAGAILNARIKKVYFGAYEPKGGALQSAYSLLSGGGLNWHSEFEGGLLKEQCSLLLTNFFKNKR